jgi:hypothetical protein
MNAGTRGWRQRKFCFQEICDNLRCSDDFVEIMTQRDPPALNVTGGLVAVWVEFQPLKNDRPVAQQ